MRTILFVLIGILIIGIISIIFINSQNNTPAATPSQTPTTIPESQVLGKETVEIPNVSTATITTSKGEIIIELFPEAAPNTVKNFAEKAENNYYNDLTFHRIEDWVVQGGDPVGNGTGGGSMPTELNNNPFIKGSVGVARSGNIEISNDSQFFITKTEAPWLDQQYTNFGQATEESMDVVESLSIGDKILSISVK